MLCNIDIIGVGSTNLFKLIKAQPTKYIKFLAYNHLYHTNMDIIKTEDEKIYSPFLCHAIKCVMQLLGFFIIPYFIFSNNY